MTTAIDPGQHLRLAGKFASPYMRRHRDIADDILSASYVGLVLAARKYDGRVKFGSYAVHWCRREIRATIRDSACIRLPRPDDVVSEPQAKAVEMAKARSVAGSDYALERLPAPEPKAESVPPVRVDSLVQKTFSVVAACRCGAEFAGKFSRAIDYAAGPPALAVRFRARAASHGWHVEGKEYAACPDCRLPGRLASPMHPPGLTRLGFEDVAAVRGLFDAGYSAAEVAGWFGIPVQLAVTLKFKGQAARRSTA